MDLLYQASERYGYTNKGNTTLCKTVGRRQSYPQWTDKCIAGTYGKTGC